MDDNEKSEPDQGVVAPRQRQPIFNLPPALLGLCVLLVAIQAASDLVLKEQGREFLAEWFAFIPYRALEPGAFAGGFWPLLWTPLTHAFLHAGWEHVGLNVVWLAIFGTPVTARYGTVGLLVLFLAGALVGALAFAATTLPHLQILVGASGGIAALTGAAVRFIFQPPVIVVDEATGERRFLGRRLASLAEFVRNPTARFFSLTWLVLNGIVPIVPMFTGAGGFQVAWQAHIGGFLAGLLLVPLFERKPR